MDNDQQSLLAAALQRAAATMRGGMQPPNFDMNGMFNPAAMASQPQPGMQPTANAQVDARFGGMQPSAQPSFADRFGAMDPAVLAKGDMLHADPSQRVAQGFPPVTAGSVPMPQPRPPQYAPPDPNRGNMTVPVPAPQPTTPMGFFQRNAAMMRDPATGAFIDPTGAARAQQQQHQGIIPNVMGFFGAGPSGTNANGSIQGAVGPTSVGGAPVQQAPQGQGGLIAKLLGLSNG